MFRAIDYGIADDTRDSRHVRRQIEELADQVLVHLKNLSAVCKRAWTRENSVRILIDD